MRIEKPDRKTVLRFIKYLMVFFVVAGLSVALGILAANNEQKRNELEGIYQKTYFEALDGLNNIETRLTKIQASASQKTRGVLLNEIASSCETTQSNLSTLTADGSETDKVMKFLNQVGDYCKFLAMKQHSEGLSEQDWTTLDKMHQLILLLRTEFNKVEAQIIDGNRIVGTFGQGINFMDAAFQNLNTSSIEYPELIYDGPFSDGLNDRELKFLKGTPEISQEEALTRVKEWFPNLSVQSVAESASTIPAYFIEFNGSPAGHLEISKQGGYLVTLNIYKEGGDTLLTTEEQVANASAFLVKMGYADMEAVWVSNNNSTVYLNFAYKTANRIYYPDLIKVKINGETGEVTGMEAQGYLYNHIARKNDPPRYSETAAREVLSTRILVKTARLTVIPTEWNTEVICYEFSATLGTEIYYIYIDANTLDEVKVLRVIEDDGTLIA